MSSTSGSTLADLRQIIADLECQLAECRAERDGALRRETAAAEVLEVINSSPGDVAPVFNAILEKALGLCGIAFGALQLNDVANTAPLRCAVWPTRWCSAAAV